MVLKPSSDFGISVGRGPATTQPIHRLVRTPQNMPPRLGRIVAECEYQPHSESGVRWDLMQYWSEKYNPIPTFVMGQQSKVLPTAPRGCYPTSRKFDYVGSARVYFSPRIGMAYSFGKSDDGLGEDHWRAGKKTVYGRDL